MLVLYVLDKNGEPVKVKDVVTWAKKLDITDRQVGFDTIGDVRVSTVFLGIDHSFYGGPPILWETMVFGGELDQYRQRCSGSREQAEAMHRDMVARVHTAEELKVC